MTALASADDMDAGLLDEAISVLRPAGRTAEAVEDPERHYRVDGGLSVTPRAIVVVTSTIGLLSPMQDRCQRWPSVRYA
jgi:hypothetical protein